MRYTQPTDREISGDPGETGSAARSLYLDFELEVGPGEGRRYPIAVIHSPAGEARSTMDFPYDELALDNRLKDLEVALLRSGGARRQTLTPAEAGVRKFGQDIFDALLSGDVRSSYDTSCREARRRGQGLRLKLRIRAPEMARLPWEYLYDGRVGEYVSLSRDTPVVRFLETSHTIEPLTVNPPLRVLAMIVSPTDLEPLQTDRERERVERALGPLEDAGLAELTWLEGETWRDLQRAMRAGTWHVFHFIGHGGFDTSAEEGVLALADEKGRAQRLLATEVGRLLADHHSLRLVLLNSCEGARTGRDDIFSSTAAVLVRRGLPAVLAMQHEITDRAAIEFARAFYEALAEGLPVDASVAEARKAVSLAVTNTIEWGTPVLYMRAPEGVIFDIPESAQIPLAARPVPQTDEATLERLYTEALSAFWVEDWQTARDTLEAIVAEQPDYGDAANKLAEAEQQLTWSSLYEQASAAHAHGDLEAAVKVLEQLVADSHDYRDAAALLAVWRKDARLDSLLTEARRLSDAEQWPAVVAVFGEIGTLIPDYEDTEGLLSTAEQGVARIELLERIEANYATAVRCMNVGDWDEALKLLTEISNLEPDFHETVRLIAKCETELAARAAAAQRAHQAASLYEEAAALAQAEQWQDALDKLERLAAIDADYDDTEEIESRAHAGLAAETEVAERQQEAAARYAEAVEALKSGEYEAALEKWESVEHLAPDFEDHRKVAATARQKLGAKERRPRRRRGLLFAGVLGLTVIAVVVGAIALSRSEAPVPSIEGVPVPSIVDHFDIDDLEGSYNTELWKHYPEAADIGQRAGVLRIVETEQGGKSWLELSSYKFDPTQSSFIEARLRLNPFAPGGNVMLGWCCTPFGTACAVQPGGVICLFNDTTGDHPVRLWDAQDMELDPTAFHTVRIEYHADQRIFSYLVNEREFGSPSSYSPPAELLETEVSDPLSRACLLRVHNFAGPGTVGYVDYFLMGPLPE